MGLRLRTAIAVTSVFLALIGAIYLLFSSFLLKEFNVLEENRARNNSERVNEQINGIAEDLGARVADWGHWDESYSFIQGSNEGYIASNLNYDALISFDLAHIIYLTSTQKIIYAAQVSKKSEDVVPLDDDISSQILGNRAVQQFFSSSSATPLQGMIRLNNIPFFIAVSTITDSLQNNTTGGFLIFTQEFSSKLQEKLIRRIKLPLEFSFPPFSTIPTNIVKQFESPGTSRTIVTQNTNTTSVYGNHRDLDDVVSVVSLITLPRDIFQQGISARNYLLTLLAAFVIIANLILLILLEKTVVGKIEKFLLRIRHITERNDPSLRIDVTNHDEIGALAQAFNHLLNVIHTTYTELTEARKAAEAANQAKSNFIAKVSHELRTPISSVMGFNDIILKAHLPYSARTIVKMSNEAARDLLETINEILDFSKAESGNTTIDITSFDLHKLVRDAGKLVSGRLHGKEGLELICDLHPNVPRIVKSDSTKIKHILVNLLGNSIKFTTSGCVSLKTKEASRLNNIPSIEFTIKDTGIGIPNNKLEHIFEPFKQVDDSTARNFQGTGLGLTIVKQFTEALGGSVTVSSTLGHGTSFTVSIPMETEEEEVINSQHKDVSVEILASETFTTTALMDGLKAHGLDPILFSPTNSTPPPEPAEISIFLDDIFDYDILVRLLDERLQSDRKVIALVKPTNISIRERLKEQGVKHILTTPTLTEDILNISNDIESSDKSEDDQRAECVLNSPNKLRVLIADDLLANRMILQSMLGESGHEVVTVNNGRELVNSITPFIEQTTDAPPFDLILTDIQMPIMDGVTATRRIRELEIRRGANHIPIFAITANALSEERERIMESGVTTVLTKPVQSEALADQLAKFVSKFEIGTTPYVSQNSKKETEVFVTNVDIGAVVQNQISNIPPRNSEFLAKYIPDSDDYFDAMFLFKRAGNSAMRTARVLEVFGSTYESSLEELIESLQANDPEQIRLSAHGLKGMLLEIGATGLAKFAGDIESKSADSQIIQLAEFVPGFSQEVHRLATIATNVSHILTSQQSS